MSNIEYARKRVIENALYEILVTQGERINSYLPNLVSEVILDYPLTPRGRLIDYISNLVVEVMHRKFFLNTF